MPQTKSFVTRRSNSTAKKHPVTYGSLSRALEQLGYLKVPAIGSHVVFVHSKSDARIYLPWRQSSQKVDDARLAGVFELVSAGGVASRDAVRTVLKASSQPQSRRQGTRAAKATVRHEGGELVIHERNGKVRVKAKPTSRSHQHASGRSTRQSDHGLSSKTKETSRRNGMR